MPQKSRIPRRDRIDILIKYIDYFKEPTLPKFSSQVWDDLAQEFDGAWTRLTWWVNVTGNRLDILSTAREEMQIEVAEIEPCGNEIDSSLDNSRVSCYNSDSEAEGGQSWFELTLSRDQWNLIKPSDSQSDVNVKTQRTLKPFGWTNIIADEFYKQHLLPCAYSFIRSEIQASSRSRNYLKIEGYCRSQSCGNTFHGYLNKQPCEKDEVIIIRIRTRDTSRDDHEDLKRYLTAGKRREYGEQSHAEGTSNMMKRLRKENMERGDVEGPIFPKADTIRHAQWEHTNRELGIDPKNDQDIVQRIFALQFKKCYMGSIKAIGYNPFYVFYELREQTSLFNQYCDTTNEWSSISIDGTGSLTKKLVRFLGIKSAHIFLHCIVIHFGKSIVAVSQMLAESQETETFTVWLRKWLNGVRGRPKQCTVDYCRALLSACSKALNDMTIKNYVEILFAFACGKFPDIESRISTYIRIDVAHFIHMICRWDCIKKIKRLSVRDFLIRCTALMVDCQDLQHFQECFALTCAVAFHCHEDTVVNLTPAVTVIEARRKLESYMVIGKVNIDGYLETLENENESNTGGENNEEFEGISGFIQGLADQAKTVVQEGNELNAFCVPEFVKELIKIGKEFVLWSAVGIPFLVGHASSSWSEKNFQDLKDKTLKRFNRGIGLEKFMILHMNDLIGGTRGVASQLLQFTMKGIALPQVQRKNPILIQDARPPEGTDYPMKTNVSPLDFSGPGNTSTLDSVLPDSDLLSQENWGGKAGSIIFSQDLEEQDAETVDEQIRLNIPHQKTGKDEMKKRKFVFRISTEKRISDGNSENPSLCESEDSVDESWEECLKKNAGRAFICPKCFTIIDHNSSVPHKCTNRGSIFKQ